MSLQDALREAQFVHCNTQEEWGVFEEKMYRQKGEFRNPCFSCRYKGGYHGKLECRKFNIHVAEYDSCKYGKPTEAFIEAIVDLAQDQSEDTSHDQRKSSGNGSPNSSSWTGCYIATAVYGSYDCPEVWTLRRYRDHTLAKTWYGRAFIRVYYAISPTLVRWFGHTVWFCRFGKNILDRVVSRLKRAGIPDAPYHDREW